MARSGIDYFPLDVSMDSKMELIEAEYGLTGFGVVVHLLQEIYGKEGYYIEWTTEVALLFAKKIGAGGNVVSEIIEASIKRGMFDKDIYDKYGVLTSRGIQKRYFEAVSRRKEIEVDDNILLVNVAQICKNADIKRKNVDISLKNVDISKQSKVEESKVKKSRVEKSKSEPQQPTLQDVINYANSRKSNVDPKRFYDFFNEAGWVDSKGNKVLSWKQKFITWESREQPTKAQKIAPSSGIGNSEMKAIEEMRKRHALYNTRNTAQHEQI